MKLECEVIQVRFNFSSCSIVYCLAFALSEYASETNFSSFRDAKAAAVEATLILPFTQVMLIGQTQPKS